MEAFWVSILLMLKDCSLLEEPFRSWEFLQGSADLDPLGNPYGFANVPIPRHTPSYPLLVTTQMSRQRSVKQLIFMSEGHYLSTDTGTV